MEGPGFIQLCDEGTCLLHLCPIYASPPSNIAPGHQEGVYLCLAAICTRKLFCIFIFPPLLCVCVGSSSLQTTIVYQYTIVYHMLRTSFSSQNAIVKYGTAVKALLLQFLKQSRSRILYLHKGTLPHGVCMQWNCNYCTKQGFGLSRAHLLHVIGVKP